ncbi:MAG: G-D-S-L family lipolytic protein [Synechococcales cyanobacterium K44_A2020_017]|jgi:lysophospholipase L1-like esterase|nr:G-D-S-L family lipolytic protein [Synechococcales cyanobacterium K32_A2020_035]MBF2095942.1 G-D-S-L family lipolytic protein [Synechococcales cyanobacterium K44_A2020_017]
MQTLVNPFESRSPLMQSHHSLRVVALGDSLIYGYGDLEGGGWVERLRRSWMHPTSPGHALYNLGIRGDGVLQVSDRLEAEFRYRGELRNKVPDVIILSVGVNDSARLGKPDGRNLTDFGKFTEVLENLLDRAQQLCPVLFVGMPPVNSAPMPFSGCLYYNHLDQARYKTATQNACHDRDIPYLDVFDLWLSRGEQWWMPRLGPDGLHPNTAGYEALLQDVLNWYPMIHWLNRSLATS